MFGKAAAPSLFLGREQKGSGVRRPAPLPAGEPRCPGPMRGRGASSATKEWWRVRSTALSTARAFSIPRDGQADTAHGTELDFG